MKPNTGKTVRLGSAVQAVTAKKTTQTGCAGCIAWLIAATLGLAIGELVNIVLALILAFLWNHIMVPTFGLSPFTVFQFFVLMNVIAIVRFFFFPSKKG